MELSQSHVHFVGIGGIGMSGLAELLVNMGCMVTGSDLSDNAQVERLRAMGVNVQKGHRAENLPTPCDVVVFSSAVKRDNPEIVAAKARKVPVIQRAEMLAEIMRFKRGIAIAGTHGKTTTTSMTASILLFAGLDPTIVVGGRLDLIKSNAALGQGIWFVAEADESDGSFLRLSPEIVVVTNIDDDHLDHFQSMERLVAGFEEFSERIPFYGRAILCTDNPLVAELSRRFLRRQLTYGTKEGADLLADHPHWQDGTQTFDVFMQEKKLGTVTLHVPGHHNMLNALAACAVGIELGLTFDQIAQGLATFRGVDRRLHARGATARGAKVIDDYGHHPTEVKATLQAIRSAYPDKHIVVVFQPHRYTRTAHCWEGFLSAFDDADHVGVIDIYPASEKPIEGITAERLAQALSKNHKRAEYWIDAKNAEGLLKNMLNESHVVVTLGAGDIWKLSVALVQASGNKK